MPKNCFGLGLVLLASPALQACVITEQTVTYKFSHSAACPTDNVNVEPQSNGYYVASGCGQARLYHCGSREGTTPSEHSGPDCEEIPGAHLAAAAR